MQKGSKHLIVALDISDFHLAHRLVGQLEDSVQMFKVGSQFFTTFGPDAVRMLLSKGKQCFLDLKFHDIPHTVACAAKAATELCVDMFNVHAAGGVEMMRATMEATKEKAAELGIKRPLVLGVTVLTSIDESRFQADSGTARSLESQVAYLAEAARAAGLDGVVASPHEIQLIRRCCGRDFVIVTPGVRPSWSQAEDQKRVMTPSEAIAAGADYIVVGRPIYTSEDSKAAALQILEEINKD